VAGGRYARWSARYCYNTLRRWAYPDRSAGGLTTIKIQVEDAAIALDDVGEGTPVLLLHGFPATRYLWSRVVPLLANSGVDMASQAHWMIQMLDTLGLARAAVVAHDVGSAAAQIMLATAPQRVRSVVVLDGVYASEWAMDAIASIQAWDPQDADRLFPVLARRLGKGPALREMLKAYEGVKGGARLIRAARDLDPRQTENIGEALRASGVPALVLWGERDEFLSIDAVGQPLADLLGARLVKLPGAHFTPLDCPAEVALELRNFLGRFCSEP
jgi:pimeloyl-ACP methyl ester carboxylesterase